MAGALGLAVVLALGPLSYYGRTYYGVTSGF